MSNAAIEKDRLEEGLARHLLKYRRTAVDFVEEQRRILSHHVQVDRHIEWLAEETAILYSRLMSVAESPSPLLPFTLIEGRGKQLEQCDESQVRECLEDRGAVLLRGYQPSLGSFADLGNRLCTSSLFNESPNRDVLEAGGSIVQSVNLGADPFPLHPELSREPWRPDLAMFSCIEPPVVGGQTNICDGIAIVENLPPELRERLAGSQLFYIRQASPEALSYWLGTPTPDDLMLANPPASCPYWFRRAPGQILRGFLRPVFEPTIFQQAPAFANFLLFARDYLRQDRIPLLDGKVFPDDWVDTIRSTARRLTYSHRWQQGDVLVLDNSRFMHGRKAIVDPRARQIATYFGYLKGVGPRPGEPADPVWRRERFIPPDQVPEN